jgi:hypothetical protein
MTFALLDTVVLTQDLPKHGLRAGDVGAIVEVSKAGAYLVEFVRASGETQALLTLASTDLRPVAEGEVLAVRQP